MIRLPAPAVLTLPERFALDVLIDLACLLPVDDPGIPAIRLELTDAPAAAGGIAAWIGATWGIASSEGVVTIPRAALCQIVDIAGGAAEQRSTGADQHGRVPSSENPLVAEGLEREPIVAQAAEALWRAVGRAAGGRPVLRVAPWPDGRRWAVAITHDLDVVSPWPLFTGLRVAELVRKGRFDIAGSVLVRAAASLGRDPVWRGVREVVDLEARRGVRSSWFVLCGTPTPRTFVRGDLTYRPESPAVRRILAEVGSRGHGLGLHGSFATASSPGEFERQRARLEKLVGRTVAGVRQHFLRLRPGSTHRAMAAAGFRYDASMGFPDRNGFRLGVADVVPAWDQDTGPIPGLDLVPFAWMDRALSKYRGIEAPEAWVSDGLELAAACRAVRGVWVGVWHPNLTPALGYPGAPEAFVALLDGLLQGRPWVATLDEIVTWRRARRSQRVLALKPDGTPVLAQPDVPLDSSAR